MLLLRSYMTSELVRRRIEKMERQISLAALGGYAHLCPEEMIQISNRLNKWYILSGEKVQQEKFLAVQDVMFEELLKKGLYSTTQDLLDFLGPTHPLYGKHYSRLNAEMPKLRVIEGGLHGKQNQ